MKDIKKLREERGLSQRVLAKKSGLSQAAISKFENSKIKDPSMYTLECLAKGLKVEISSLVD